MWYNVHEKLYIIYITKVWIDPVFIDKSCMLKGLSTQLVFMKLSDENIYELLKTKLLLWKFIGLYVWGKIWICIYIYVFLKFKIPGIWK
jgi:hypothetical protein